jgi:Na+-transporting methylmalonyl-CoA/oxaloacetate decarboxylase beta subunit
VLVGLSKQLLAKVKVLKYSFETHPTAIKPQILKRLENYHEKIIGLLQMSKGLEVKSIVERILISSILRNLYFLPSKMVFIRKPGLGALIRKNIRNS